MQGLPQKQTKAIVSLMNCRTVSDAASQAGVNESTVWRWMRDQAFQEALREAKHQTVTQALLQIQQATGEAVATLRGIMVDDGVPTSSRVTAAKAVLDMALKAAKLEDLEARLMILEQR